MQNFVTKQRLMAAVTVWLPIALLAFSTFCAAWYASRFFVTVQDNIIYPYLFQNFHLHDMVLPGDHTNLLKFPLFILQSLLPYTPKMLKLVDILLVVAGVGGACWLLLKMVGKKYVAIVCLTVSCILLGSYALNFNLAETTIRNIEYPIGLAFILVVNSYLTRQKYSLRWKLLAAITGALFTISVAGDTFMTYAFVAPVMVVLAMYALRARTITRKLIVVLVAVVAVVIVATVLRNLLPLTGVAKLFFADTFQTKVLAFNKIGDSFAGALNQLFMLTGGDIFGKNLALGNALNFFNFLLTIVGFIGLMKALKKAWHKYRHVHVVGGEDFLLAALAISFVCTLLAFVVSGLALNPDMRYISLLPFLLVPGVVVMVRDFYNHSTKTALTTILATVFVLIVSSSSIVTNFVTVNLVANNRLATVLTIEDTLKANHVNLVVTGDTLGATLRFWSNNKLPYASIHACNRQMPHNVRLSWYRPNGTTPVALVVDRTGIDGPFWQGCSAQALKDIYGQPAKELTAKNPAGTEPTDIWIYNYDIRSKLTANQH